MPDMSRQVTGGGERIELSKSKVPGTSNWEAIRFPGIQAGRPAVLIEQALAALGHRDPKGWLACT